AAPRRDVARDQPNGTDPYLPDFDSGRYDGDTIARTGQRNGGVRSCALQQDPRTEVSNAARSFEPVARSKTAAQQQERLVAELSDIDGSPAGKSVGLGKNCQAIGRIKQPMIKTFIIHRNERKKNVSSS